MTRADQQALSASLKLVTRAGRCLQALNRRPPHDPDRCRELLGHLAQLRLHLGGMDDREQRRQRRRAERRRATPGSQPQP